VLPEPATAAPCTPAADKITRSATDKNCRDREKTAARDRILGGERLPDRESSCDVKNIKYTSTSRCREDTRFDLRFENRPFPAESAAVLSTLVGEIQRER
jgi:hypothetical protein